MLTEREKHIKAIFLPENRSPKKDYMSENEVMHIIKKISLIGENLGFIGNDENKNREKSEKRKHKFDVWIAKEAKKDLDILDKIDNLRLIKDWVLSTMEDIFKYNFESAIEGQKKWHEELMSKFDITSIQIPDIDESRIIFKNSDKEHFFYLLDHRDLDYEGAALIHCVSGNDYKTRIKKGRSIIVSLRDIKNIPKLTIEFEATNGRVLQQYGYKNKTPSKKHRQLIAEFALHVCGYEDENKELLNFLNLNYLFSR